MKITNGKSQLNEPPVFFLDRNLGKNKLVEMLRSNEFVLRTHFEEYGEEGHKVGDPAIIQDCGRKNYVLLTGDQDIVHTYAREIRDAGIAVFVTTENNEGPAMWGPRIIAAKVDIWRELKRRKKPFTAMISKDGAIAQVRIYERSEWKSIRIGRKNPPHVNRQKEAEPSSSGIQESGNGPIEDQAGAETYKGTPRHEEKEGGKMNNVVESHGVCEAQKCKRDGRLITSEADKVVVRKKAYHKGCEPTPQELAAFDRS